MLRHIENCKIHYGSYAVLRSTLALSTLLTIIFNTTDTLFPAFVENNNLVYSKITFLDYNVSYFIFQNILYFKIFSSGILFLVISGGYPRVTGILHFIVSYVFFNTAIAIDGGDQIISNVTFLLIPITLLDRNSNHWKNNQPAKSLFTKTIFHSFSFLICLQVCVIYLHSAIAKLNVDEWLNGTAIWYWFRHEIFGANYFILDVVNFLLKQPSLIYCLNYSIIILEILIAMMLFVNKERFIAKVTFIIAVIFHIGIILMHGIFSFALVMIGCLFFYFNKKLKFQ